MVPVWWAPNEAIQSTCLGRDDSVPRVETVTEKLAARYADSYDASGIVYLYQYY